MRKQELIIFIGVIALLFVMFLVYVLTSLFSPSESPGSPRVSPRPSTSSRPFDTNQRLSPPPPILLPSSLPQPNNEITKQDLINLLPIQTDFTNIEYLSVSDSFAITIKKNPYQENRTKVEKWFTTQGFNLSQLNVYWQTYPEVDTE